MWANKYLFDPSVSAPLLQASPTEAVLMDKPPVIQQMGASDSEEELPSVEKSEVESKGDPLAEGVMTLSSLPATQWQGILHLEEIKERNKPTEAPKKPEIAPFFLPTMHTSPQEAVFVAPEESKVLTTDETHKLRDMNSPLQQLLAKGDHDETLSFLLKQTASGVHLVISDIGPLAGGSLSELSQMMEFFEFHIEKCHHADLIQTYLSLFIQTHGDMFSGEEGSELQEKARRLQSLIKHRWEAIDQRCNKITCFLKVFCNVALETA